MAPIDGVALMLLGGPASLLLLSRLQQPQVLILLEGLSLGLVVAFCDTDGVRPLLVGFHVLHRDGLVDDGLADV